MPFPNLAAIKASYSMLQSGQTEPLRSHLNQLTKSFYNQLKSALLRRNLVKDTTEILQIPLKCPKSPIFALQTPSPRSLATFCQEEGFIVRAVVPPTVPTRRVRVCLHAGNTKEQIEELVDRIDLWLGTQLGNGILPSLGPGAMGQFEEDTHTSAEEKLEAKKEEEEDDDFVKAMI
jgi:8-amino-7-oxononanoate synthase